MLQIKRRGIVIDYLKDLSVIGSKITKCPYILKGPIGIVTSENKKMRCPAWGTGREVIKFDKEFIYVKSDTAGMVDVFDEMGAKIKEINIEDLK